MIPIAAVCRGRSALPDGPDRLRSVSDVAAEQTAEDTIEFTWDAGDDVGGDNAYAVQTQVSINGGEWANTGNEYVADDEEGEYVHVTPFEAGDEITVRIRRVNVPLPSSAWVASNTVVAVDPPVADFSIDNETISIGSEETATLTSLSTPPEATLLWEIYDPVGMSWEEFGTDTTLVIVAVEFGLGAGTYDVRLTATYGELSNTETKTSFFTVTP